MFCIENIKICMYYVSTHVLRVSTCIKKYSRLGEVIARGLQQAINLVRGDINLCKS